VVLDVVLVLVFFGVFIVCFGLQIDVVWCYVFCFFVVFCAY